MNFKAHVLAGFAAFCLLMAAGAGFSPALLAVALLGAVLPDADHENSRQYFAISGFLVGACGAVVFFLAQGSSGTANAIVAAGAAGAAAALLLPQIKPRHRGIMHSFAACLAYAGLVAAVAWKTGVADWIVLGAGAAAGFASHLVLDREFKVA